MFGAPPMYIRLVRPLRMVILTIQRLRILGEVQMVISAKLKRRLVRSRLKAFRRREVSLRMHFL